MDIKNIKKTNKALSLSVIKPNPEQNRVIFDEDKLKEMADNMLFNGQRQAIEVAVNPKTQEIVLIDGERRLRASAIGAMTRLENKEISDPSEHTIDAIIFHPETIDEYEYLLKTGMINGNEYSLPTDFYEKGTYYREKLRVKTFNYTETKEYDTLRNYAENLLGYIGIKELTEDQSLILNNTVKRISRQIQTNGGTTHYIEDKIENNGVCDKYLMYKIAILAKELGLESVKFGSERKKQKEKYNSFVEKEDKEIWSLDESKKIKYDRDIAQRKKEKFLNSFYDNLCEFIIDGTYSLNNPRELNEWRAIIDEKFEASMQLANSVAKVSSVKVTKLKNLGGSTIKVSPKGYDLKVTASAIENTAINGLLNQFISLMKEEESRLETN